MQSTWTPAKLKRLLLTAALALLANGCIKAGPSLQCEALDFKVLSGKQISEIDIYDGNRDRMAPQPRVTIHDPARIAALQSFLLGHEDGWFVAAGETYDPNSRKANSVITAVFKSGDETVARFGYSPAFLETPGCDFEVILILSPADNERILDLLGDVLPPAASAN